ncbi:MAG: D-alanyl-D-alanine carboxypeptidase family protein [Brevundimonas sp.]
MNRLLRHALIVLAVMGLSMSPSPWMKSPNTANAQTSERYAAVVLNSETGELLFNRHGREKRYPASITKVMTLYMVFEGLEDGRLSLQDRVRISPRAAAQPPSKLGLPPGRTLSVHEAIQALAVRSANDVAVALAEHMSGSVEAFGRASTARAYELGMVQSTFVNPHGLPDPRQVSSALDLALLSQAVMRDYPQYYHYFGQRRWRFEGREFVNTNGLLQDGGTVDGIKTGFTRASGYNLAASSVHDGRRLITVVLGGRSSSSRNAHVAALMQAGFEVEARRSSQDQIQSAQAFFESRGFGLEGASDAPIPAGPVPYLDPSRALGWGSSSAAGAQPPVADDEGRRSEAAMTRSNPAGAQMGGAASGPF